MRPSVGPARRLLAAIAAALAVALPAPALAHGGGSIGYASIVVGPRGAIQLSLTLTPDALPPKVAEELRRARAGDPQSIERLVAVVRGHLRLSAAGTLCVAGPGRLEPSQVTTAAVALVVAFACPEPLATLRVRDDLFDAFGQDHHTLATFEWAGGTHQFAFRPEARETELRLEAAGGGPRWSGSFFLLGVEHILAGWDHLLFLLALLLRGGGFLSLLKIITAFTAAHSVTLALAALEVVTLPGRFVEAVIALSIAYVAAENLFLPAAASHRWLVSFVFGLAHGFGFSSVLRDMHLPTRGLVLSLLGFNLGVESGQAVVVGLVLPLLAWLRHTRWEPRMVWGSSAAILVVGLVLFVERLLM